MGIIGTPDVLKGKNRKLREQNYGSLISDGFNRDVAKWISDEGIPVDSAIAIGADRFNDFQTRLTDPLSDHYMDFRNISDMVTIYVNAVKEFGEAGESMRDAFHQIATERDYSLEDLLKFNRLVRESNLDSGNLHYHATLEDIQGYESLQINTVDDMVSAINGGLRRGRDVPLFIERNISDKDTIARLQVLKVSTDTMDRYIAINITDGNDMANLAGNRVSPEIASNVYQKNGVNDAATIYDLDTMEHEYHHPRGYVAQGVTEKRIIRALDRVNIDPLEIPDYRSAGIEEYEDMVTAKEHNISGIDARDYSEAGFYREKQKMKILKDGGVDGRTAVNYSTKEGLKGDDEMMVELSQSTVGILQIDEFERAGFKGRYQSMVNLTKAGVNSSKALELSQWFEGNEEAMLTIQEAGFSINYLLSQIDIMNGTKPEPHKELLGKLVDLYRFENEPVQSPGN